MIIYVRSDVKVDGLGVARMVADALRNRQISFKEGASLIDNAQKLLPDQRRSQIEKLIDGAPLPAARAIPGLYREVAHPARLDKKTGAVLEPERREVLRGIDAIPWKKESVLVVLGEGPAMAEIEALCPGFAAHFAPSFTLRLSEAQA